MENEDKNETDATSTLIESESLLPSQNIYSKKIIIGLTLTIGIAVLLAKVCPDKSYGFFRHTWNMSSTTSSSEMYSVVFDAGSTGSRVFVFHFKYEKTPDNTKSNVVKLFKETFMFVEPGISFFASSPQKAADSLKPLLLKAVETVPPHFHPTTLVLFKATAGLRLLSKAKGEQIMSEVKNLFLYSSPFYLPDPEKVEVMGGSEEGLFGWLTVNFLRGSIWNSKSHSSAAAIDLGGGSLQLTFDIPSNILPKQMCEERLGEMYILKLSNSQFEVHTHSFLGYGLKSAYLQIMGGIEQIQEQAQKNQQKLSTPCFEPGFESTWHHGGVDYIITGQKSNASRLEACRLDIDTFVENAGFTPSALLLSQELYLFSYFFDIARWAGMVPKKSRQILLTPADFYASAENHCQSKEFSKDRPFQCMNLLYIHSFLTTGLQLPSTKMLHVESEIAGHEVSWALGSALSSLSDVCSFTRICSGA